MEKEQEARLKAQLGGRIPNRAEILRNQLSQRRYFDSGDYAMSKAGKKPEPGQELGVEHPVPEQIPHHSPTSAQHSNPVRRPSSLAQGSESLRATSSRASPLVPDDSEEAIQ